jgi:hypothetical protein
MEKSMKRAERRHHVQRLKQTRAKYVALNWWDNQPKRLGMLTQNPKKCSCYMCGNPRKWDNEKTLTEYRHYDILEDGLQEVLSEEVSENEDHG